ncbi:14053_t:CDS:1, partial [Rhizophagus irregularis]
MRVGRILPEVMVAFRKFLYMEESIAKSSDYEIFNFLIGIGYKKLPVPFKELKEEHKPMWDRYILKVRQKFIDTRQFTKELEDPESASPESYELEDSD